MGGDTTSLVGLAVVSNLTWLVTLPTTRFLGGTAWLFAMGLFASSSCGRTWVNEVIDGVAPTSVAEIGACVAAVVAVPFLFLVPTARGVAGHPVILLATATLSFLALGVGVRWILVLDFPGGGVGGWRAQPRRTT